MEHLITPTHDVNNFPFEKKIVNFKRSARVINHIM